MLRQYHLQSQRLTVIRKCAAVVTHSEHMRDEYVRNGIPADRVFNFPFYAAEFSPEQLPLDRLPACPTLLFLGRMEAAKGGNVLLDALPRARASSTARFGSCSPGRDWSGRSGKHGQLPSRR